MRFVNEAGWDRIVRIVLGGVMLILGWSGLVGGIIVLLLAGLVGVSLRFIQRRR